MENSKLIDEMEKGIERARKNIELRKVDIDNHVELINNLMSRGIYEPAKSRASRVDELIREIIELEKEVVLRERFIAMVKGE